MRWLARAIRAALRGRTVARRAVGATPIDQV